MAEIAQLQAYQECSALFAATDAAAGGGMGMRT